MTPNDEGIRAVNQDEHNSDAHAKRVVQRYQNPADGNWYNYNPMGGVTERYDYSDSTTIYTGYAPLGTSNGSTGWTITKYDLASSSAASGKIAVDVTWTDRASGTYS